MSSSMSTWLLKGALVLAAFFLGLALNTFSSREPFKAFKADRPAEPVRREQASESAATATGRQAALDAQSGDKSSGKAPGQGAQPADGSGGVPARADGQAGDASSQPKDAERADAPAPSAGQAAGSQAAGQGAGAPASADSKESGTDQSASPGTLAAGDAAQGGTSSGAGQGEAAAAAREQAAAQSPPEGKASFADGSAPEAAPLVPPRVESSPGSLRAAGVGRRVALGMEAKGRETARDEESAREQVQVRVAGGDQVQGQVAAPGPGGKVLEIATEDRPGEFVLTVSFEGAAERVTTFSAKEPPRLAVDLWGTWKFTGAPVRTIVDGLMDRVRIGAHPDRLRLVVDYRDKATDKPVEAVVEKKPGAVVVRVPKPR